MTSATDRDRTTAVRISVPARADVVQVVRSVVGGAAALHAASYEAIEDLRLSADEACAHLLTTLPKGTRLFVETVPVDGGLAITVSIDAESTDWPAPYAHESLAWYVLSALTDDAAFVRLEGRPAIRFTKRLGHA